MRPASRTPPTSRRGPPSQPDASALYGQADVILKVTPPSKAEAGMLKEGATTVSFLYPLANLEAVKALSARKATAFAMELIPRISRAQPMDALSSQSNLGGYKAALLAAEALPRIFPMMMTAAGTISPAKVFVLGAGVAGLQAIATARRLGAVLEAYDVRPIVKEQIESLGRKVRPDAGGDQGRPGRRRVREGPDAGVLREAAEVPGGASLGLRRGHNDGAHTRAACPHSDIRRGSQGDEERLSRRRHRGGAGRELRADRAG